MAHRPLSAIVMAAGEGTRMRSEIPKPLHRILGRPMVLHVIDALAELPIDRVVVVVGHGSNDVTKTIDSEAPADLRLEYVEQKEQLGTGDAAAVALTGFPDATDLEDGDLVVLPGDTPLVRPATLAALVRMHRSGDSAATLLTARLENPAGYGRILRNKDGRVARIVDDADATDEEKLIDEVATSIYCFRHSVLAPALRRLSPANAQGEYYLTDTIAVLHEAGYRVDSLIAEDAREAAGVNDRAQLAAAGGELRERVNERWMRRGVTMVDPNQTYLDTQVRLGTDVTLLPGVILEGKTTIGERAVIGPNVHLISCEVASGAHVEQSSAELAFIGEESHVGPFAVLQPGTRVEALSATGSFTTLSGVEDQQGGK